MISLKRSWRTFLQVFDRLKLPAINPVSKQRQEELQRLDGAKHPGKYSQLQSTGRADCRIPIRNYVVRIVGQYGLANSRFTVAELAEMGVRRISLGSALSRTALTAFLRAARERLNQGTFTFADDAASYYILNAMFKDAAVRATQNPGI